MNTFTRTAVLRRDGRRCLRCSSPKELTVDHIVPRAAISRLLKDNDTIAAFHHYTVERSYCNYQTLCRRCNKDKSDGKAYDYRGSVSLWYKLINLLDEFEMDIELYEGIPIWRDDG